MIALIYVFCLLFRLSVGCYITLFATRSKQTYIVAVTFWRCQSMLNESINQKKKKKPSNKCIGRRESFLSVRQTFMMIVSPRNHFDLYCCLNNTKYINELHIYIYVMHVKYRLKSHCITINQWKENHFNYILCNGI